MGATTSTDFSALVPEIFQPLAQTRLAKFIDFLMFGLADQFQVGAGLVVPVPSFGELSGTVDISQDKNDIEINAVTPILDEGVVCRGIKAFGAEDLVKICSGIDPNTEIANRISRYFAKNFVQTRFFNVLTGLFSAAGPLYATNLHSVYADVAKTAATYAIMTPEVAIDGIQKLGDEMENVAAWVMHSKVMGDVYKAGYIGTATAVPPVGMNADGTVKTFLGKPIIMADSVTKTAGTSSTKYRTFGITRSALALGIQKDLNPEFGRDALNKKEYLSTDMHAMMHVRGCKYVGATGSGKPTVALLEAGASWELVAEDAKFVGVVAIDTN